MFPLFGCKNCKDANIELAQTKDELFKLKLENKRLESECAQARGELLKLETENNKSKQIEELAQFKTETERLFRELQEARRTADFCQNQLLQLKTENQRLSRELEESKQNTVSVAASELEEAIFITQQTAEVELNVAQEIRAFIQTNEPEVIYIASWNRNHFHRPDCIWMENLPESKLRKFYSHEQAVKAGCRPCKTCCA